MLHFLFYQKPFTTLIVKKKTCHTWLTQCIKWDGAVISLKAELPNKLDLGDLLAGARVPRQDLVVARVAHEKVRVEWPVDVCDEGGVAVAAADARVLVAVLADCIYVDAVVTWAAC